MAIYESKGEVVIITAAENLSAGDLVHLGESRCGVALEDIANDATGPVAIQGKFYAGVTPTSAGVTIHKLITPSGDANKKVTQLEDAETPAESADLTVPNIRADATVTAAGTVAKFTLLG